jgi:transposase
MKRKAIFNKKQKKIRVKTGNSLPILYPDSAGIDVGSASHFVAVPSDRDDQCVQEFLSFTSDLYKMVAWLQKCQIKTIIMESTGVFWIPLFEILDQNGFDVKLVNAYYVKNVSAHKTDVLDCQWLQQLACFGLLKGAFRPENDIVALRAYLRHRDNLIKCASEHIQRMQKSLTQMNIQLHNVISDITGKTGMDIIRAIVGGTADPKVLAKLRNERCHNSEEIIMQSLIGNYREEHLFTLKQELDLYDMYSSKIKECDAEIMSQISRIETKKNCKTEENKEQKDDTKELNPRKKKSRKLKKHEYPLELREELVRITGVDLTLIPGIEAGTAIALIGEIGTDMSKWRSAKHFASWLGLSPGNKVSGGKRLSGKTKHCANRAAIMLRMSANTLYNADSAHGAFLRRMKTRLGSPKAITACAHKLAKQVYFALKYGRQFEDTGAAKYEAQYQKKKLVNIKRRAAEMGYKIIPIENVA